MKTTYFVEIEDDGLRWSTNEWSLKERRIDWTLISLTRRELAKRKKKTTLTQSFLSLSLSVCDLPRLEIDQNVREGETGEALQDKGGGANEREKSR